MQNSFDPTLLCCIAALFMMICVVLLTGLARRWINVHRAETELKNEKARFLKELGDMKRSYEDVRLAAWLNCIQENKYHNEIEVEVKFIYPMMLFLGYANNQMSVRVHTEVQAGRSRNRCEADWVIWNDDERSGDARLIIEAKGPDETLDDDVQQQARSYAFALNAAAYMLVNGRCLKIYRRGVQRDNCVVDCMVENLAEAWPEVVKYAGQETQLN